MDGLHIAQTESDINGTENADQIMETQAVQETVENESHKPSESKCNEVVNSSLEKNETESEGKCCQATGTNIKEPSTNSCKDEDTVQEQNEEESSQPSVISYILKTLYGLNSDYHSSENNETKETKSEQGTGQNPSKSFPDSDPDCIACDGTKTTQSPPETEPDSSKIVTETDCKENAIEANPEQTQGTTNPEESCEPSRSQPASYSETKCNENASDSTPSQNSQGTIQGDSNESPDSSGDPHGNDNVEAVCDVKQWEEGDEQNRGLLLAASFINSVSYENSIMPYETFPRTESPVHILGEQYSALYDMREIEEDVLSRLWFTYRKGFAQIGGTGPNSDTGWGCMLRCGQMMLGQALLNRHLTRSWRWRPENCDPKYYEILKMFQDKKGSCYSIHQIASMGASEGKAVGQWFGPNTVAQVLRKLAVYDEWSDIKIHVAMDNTVIMDDIKNLCSCTCKSCRAEIAAKDKLKRKTRKNTHNSSTVSPVQVMGFSNGHAKTIEQNGEKSSHWKPLLLVIPLRLGLSEMNAVYNGALKTALTFKHSVGIIGGKPNHAHWFIGFVEDELIYLDPHTTQSFVDVTTNMEETPSVPGDETFHCPYAARMHISQLDPSIALGFYCGTEAEFDDLCQSIQKFIVHGHKSPMFELHKERPSHWPPFEPYAPTAGTSSDFSLIADRQYDTDEEFELL